MVRRSGAQCTVCTRFKRFDSIDDYELSKNSGFVTTLCSCDADLSTSNHPSHSARKCNVLAYVYAYNLYHDERQNGDMYIVLKVQLQPTNRQSPNNRTNDLYTYTRTHEPHTSGRALFFLPIRNMKRNIWICAGIKSNGNKSISKRRFNYNIDVKRGETQRVRAIEEEKRGCRQSKRACMSFCVKIKPGNNKNHVQ